MKLSLGVSPRHGAIALAAGLLGAAAFWPLALWPLIALSVAILMRLLRDLDVTSARNVGLVYGIAFAGGTMYWLFSIFGVLAVPLLALMAAYFGLFATLFALTRGAHPILRALLAATFAVAVEWLRGDAWYLRFPWYTPPHAMAAAPQAIAAARWVGAYGLSFLVWLIAAGGAFHWRAYVGFAMLGAFWFLTPAEGEADRKVLLIQNESGNVEQVIASVPARKVDLAVLPELAYTRSPESVLPGKNGPSSLASKVNAPVVFGTVKGTYGEMPFENVAAVVTADGTLLGTFTKQRPVPLMVDGTPGTSPVFETDDGVLGVAICYDFDAPHVSGSLVESGATVLVAPTMDLMEWGRAQHEHHALLFRLRAVENNRWLLRASSSGRSEVISPRGVASGDGVEIGKAGYTVLPFAHNDAWSLGSRAWRLGPAAALATALYLAWRIAMWLRRKKRPAEAEAAPLPSPAP